MSNLTAAQMGRLGGMARDRKLSKAQKSAIGKKGAAARWGKGKADERDSAHKRKNRLGG